jgi:hypothetical protein
VPDSSVNLNIHVNSNASETTLKGLGNALAQDRSGAIGLATTPLRSFATSLAGLAASALSVGTAIRFVTQGFKGSFSDENLIVSIAKLTGSMETARARFEAIDAMRFEWPIDTEELVTASNALSRFSGGALSGMDSLKLAADAASATGQSPTQIAESIGRAYAEIKSGTSGRGMMGLANAGILSPAAREDLENLKKSGADNTVIWQRLQDELGKFSGAMERDMSTTDAKIKKVGIAWGDVQKAFSTPITSTLAEIIDEVPGLLKNLEANATNAGYKVAAVIELFSKAMSQDRLGEVVAAAIKYGVISSAGVFLLEMVENIAYIGKTLAAVVASAANAFTKYVVSGMSKAVGWVMEKLGIVENFDYSQHDVSLVGTFSDTLNEFNRDWKLGKGADHTLSKGVSDLASEDLKKLFADFNVVVGTPAAETRRKEREKKTFQPQESPADPTAETSQGRSKSTLGHITDNYARFGLFASASDYSGINTALNYSRRTADSAEKQTKLLTQIANTLKTTSATPTAAAFS